MYQVSLKPLTRKADKCRPSVIARGPRGTELFEAHVFLHLLPGLAGDLRCPLLPAPAGLCRCPGTERVWWPAAWQKLSACRERKVLGVSRQEMGSEVMGGRDSVFPSFLPVLTWAPVPVWELKPMVLDGCPSLCLSVCLSGAVCLCVAFLSCSFYPGHFCSFPFASVTALFTVSLSLYLSQLFPPHCLPAGSTSLHGASWFSAGSSPQAAGRQRCSVPSLLTWEAKAEERLLNCLTA